MPRASRGWIAAIIMLMVMPLTTMAQRPDIASPQETPPAIDCAGLRAYWNHVYYGFEPELSHMDRAIITAAWDGPDAWDEMSRTELTLARDFYEAWGAFLRDVDDDQIPDGLQGTHESLTRNIELMGEKLDAYLRRDWDALEAASTETVANWEDLYAASEEGVEQCGRHWTRVFGEPWDPTPDATPAATPSATPR